MFSSERLRRFVAQYGTNRWSTPPDRAQLARDATCPRPAERGHFYFSPDIQRGAFTAKEEDTIIRLHAIHGDWWWQIAWSLPGRTPNSIKNHWRRHLSQRLVAQGIDPTTHRPLAETTSSSDSQQSTVTDDGDREMVPLPPSPAQPNPPSAAPGAGEDDDV
ncbi:unnamed protein product [Urochloa humidicola]